MRGSRNSATSTDALFSPRVVHGPREPSKLRKLKTLSRLLDLDEETQQQLSTCEEETTIPARSLMRMALRAALTAIEKSGYRVVVPMEFTIAPDNIPMPNRGVIGDPDEIEPGMTVSFTDGEAKVSQVNNPLAVARLALSSARRLGVRARTHHSTQAAS